MVLSYQDCSGILLTHTYPAFSEPTDTNDEETSDNEVDDMEIPFDEDGRQTKRPRPNGIDVGDQDDAASEHTLPPVQAIHLARAKPSRNDVLGWGDLSLYHLSVPKIRPFDTHIQIFLETDFGSHKF